MAKTVTITNGTGTSELINGTYSVSASASGYDNTSINPNTLINMYREYSNVIGKNINYQNKEYLVKNIDKDGHLIIENESETKTITSDEISITDAIIM